MTPQDAARGWLRQARNDLVHARWSLQAGHADWACLAAHHAAEKALKGLALDAGHRPLSTNNPALLAVDLMELGILDEDEVAGLGDLETLESIALQVRDPDRAVAPAGTDATDPALLAQTAVGLTERLLGLVATAARHDRRPPRPQAVGDPVRPPLSG